MDYLECQDDMEVKDSQEIQVCRDEVLQEKTESQDNQDLLDLKERMV